MGLLDFDISKITDNPAFMLGTAIGANNTGHYGQFAPALSGGLNDYQRQAAMQKMLAEQKAQQEAQKQWWSKKAPEMMNAPADAQKAFLTNMYTPKKREMYKAADGYQYWQDTNERVNPNVVAPEKSPLVTVDMGKEGGKSFSKELGDMVRESKNKSSQALKDFEAANRMQQVLDSDLYNLGPTANIQQFYQQAKTLWGESDPRLKNTRALIQGLAQTAVGARSMLAGQGQVTENEAAAVEKVTSGQIDTLTKDELQLLVDLSRKAARVTAQDHTDYINQMKVDFPGYVPYYNVRGLDSILNWQAPEFKPNKPKTYEGFSVTEE